MPLFALLLTLVIEQFRPLPARSALSTLAASVADAAERNLNAGQARHGMYAWLVLVGGLGLLTLLVHLLAGWMAWLLALAFNVVVLYLTLGFRQFSHAYTAIREAVEAGELDRARRELTAWKQHDDPAFDAGPLEAEELIRQALEHGLLLSQRHVFGVFFWYVLLPGPMGPVMYRCADYLARRWNRGQAAGAALPPDRFGEFARVAFAWCDWLPARLTAAGFAIVGDFEGALYCWRRVAADGPLPAGEPRPDSRTVLLAAASGALGTRLLAAGEAARHFNEPGLEGAGLAEPQPRSLAIGAALIWRAVVLWLGLLLLLSLVHWFT